MMCQEGNENFRQVASKGLSEKVIFDHILEGSMEKSLQIPKEGAFQAASADVLGQNHAGC